MNNDTFDMDIGMTLDFCDMNNDTAAYDIDLTHEPTLTLALFIILH